MKKLISLLLALVFLLAFAPGCGRKDAASETSVISGSAAADGGNDETSDPLAESETEPEYPDAQAEITDTVYTFDLTEEQAESYSDSVFFILEEVSDNLFGLVYKSEDVEFDGKSLSASFNGYVPYIQNEFGEFSEISYYSYEGRNGNRSVFNIYPSLEGGNTDDDGSGYVTAVMKLSVADGEREFRIDSVFTRNTEKKKELKLDEWEDISFGNIGGFRFLPEAENGTVLPFTEWRSCDSYLFSHDTIAEGIRFIYAPLSSGNYFYTFMVTDAQDNSYCSLPAAIETPEPYLRSREPDSDEIEWTGGDNCVIFEKEGVTVSIDRIVDELGRIGYCPAAENKTDRAVRCVIDLKYANDSVFLGDYKKTSFDLEPGETYCFEGEVERKVGDWLKENPDGDVERQTTYYRRLLFRGYGPITLDFDDEIAAGLLTELRSMTVSIEVRDPETDARIYPAKNAVVRLSDETGTGFGSADIHGSAESAKNISEPFRGVVADEQVVYEKDGVKITLVAFGTSINDYESGFPRNLYTYFNIENGTDGTVGVYFDGISFNKAFSDLYILKKIPPHSKVACAEKTWLESADLKALGVRSVDSVALSVIISRGKYPDLFLGENVWCPVEIESSGTRENRDPLEGLSPLFEKDGISVYVTGYSDSSSPRWDLIVKNDSDRDTKFLVRYNGKSESECRAGAGQMTMFDITVYGSSEEEQRKELTIDYAAALSFSEAELFWEVKNAFVITAEQ